MGMFDLTRVTLLVAAVDPADGNEAARLISAAGSQYKWMDATHILVVLRASGGAAVRKAAELAAKVHGVVSWMGFDEWRAAQAACTNNITRLRVAPCGRDTDMDDLESFTNLSYAGDTPRVAGSVCVCDSRKGWGPGLLVAGASVLLVLLLVRGKTQLSLTGARLFQRWCER